MVVVVVVAAGSSCLVRDFQDDDMQKVVFLKS
jgi:hypothetical protein